MFNILFLSTNPDRGGSESLWKQAVNDLLNDGNKISVGTLYTLHENELSDKVSFKFDYRPSLYKIFINKVFKSNVDVSFKNNLKKANPDLIVISQGNNCQAIDYIEMINQLGYKYCLLTHLVTEFHWLNISSSNLPIIQSVYNRSLGNFFVSQANIELHKKMICMPNMAADVVFNTGYDKNVMPLPFPDIKTLKLAFVGRIEMFHKGLDLLVDILTLDKWRRRDIEVEIYGDGPHLELMALMLDQKSITNIKLMGPTNNVTEVWLKNHLLILPSRMEGQSISLFEALAAGRSTIITNVGGASEVIENDITGFIAESPTIESIDNAMERAWDRKDQLQDFGLLSYKKLMQHVPDDPILYFNNKIKGLI